MSIFTKKALYVALCNAMFFPVTSTYAATISGIVVDSNNYTNSNVILDTATTGSDSAHGIDVIGTGSSVNIDGSSKITVSSESGDATGIDITGSDSSVSISPSGTLAEQLKLSVSSSSGTATGINLAADNQELTLGSVDVRVKSTDGDAFGYINSAGENSTSIGTSTGQSISTIQAVSENGQAIAAHFTNQDVFDFNTEFASIIAEGQSGYGILVEGAAQGSEINLSNTTVSMTGGDAAISISSDSDITLNIDNGFISGRDGANGIEAGSGIINITGTTTINASEGNDIDNLTYHDAINLHGDAVANVNTTGSELIGNLVVTDDATLDLNGSGIIFLGSTDVSGNGVLDVNLTDGSYWAAIGSSTLSNLTLGNGSTIHIGNLGQDYGGTQSTGNSITVKGDYVGAGGTIVFDTILGDDSSTTDKLIVEGNTSGTTNVHVDNLGGQGADTIKGIELITVGGQSDGEFLQDGRIVAGAYEYYLVRGEGENSNNWYLVNNEDYKGNILLRPEGLVYSSNLNTANTIFNSRLQDRLGESSYIDPITGKLKATSMWARQEIGKNKSSDRTGQLQTDADRYVVQLGGDVAQWSTNDKNRYHLGAMVGYASQSSDTINRFTGNKASGSMEGVNVGLYGTWFQNAVDNTGLYVDTWAQYSWFKNTVSGDDVASEKYNSKGATASIESGYTALVKSTENAKFYLQPKAQVTWMGVKADKHVESNGTVVTGLGDDNVQSRIGLRAYMNKQATSSNVQPASYQPFFEANWIHNTEDYGVLMDDVTVYQDGLKDIGEVKLGVEGQVSQNTAVWGNVAYQFGGNDYSDTVAKLGVKLTF